MFRKTLSLIILGLALLPVVKAADAAHPVLPMGAAAPDFCLPGIDDKTHCLKDYSSSKILAIIFTCNHCPTAQLYENRIKKLVADTGSGALLSWRLNRTTPSPSGSMKWATPTWAILSPT